MIDYSDETGWPASITPVSKTQKPKFEWRPLWLRAFYPNNRKQMKRDLARGFARRST